MSALCQDAADFKQTLKALSSFPSRRLSFSALSDKISIPAALGSIFWGFLPPVFSLTLFRPGNICPGCVSCDGISPPTYKSCIRKEQIILFLPSLILQMCPMAMFECDGVWVRRDYRTECSRFELESDDIVSEDTNNSTGAQGNFKICLILGETAAGQRTSADLPVHLSLWWSDRISGSIWLRSDLNLALTTCNRITEPGW